MIETVLYRGCGDVVRPADPAAEAADMVEARERWIGRPWAARAVRLLSYLVPFATSIVAAFVLSSFVPPAPHLALGILRWAGIAAVSTVVLVLTDRVARRVLPLSALLKLTLAFPDQAPSRFRIAIRSGTTRQLERRLEEAARGDLGETPTQAAVRLLELVGMLALHDRLTRGHSERVRAYTQMIGTELGITGEELDRMHWAGLLHDVGKLAIDTAILNKPGTLTEDEYEIVKTHPMEGKKLVEPLVDWLGDAARAVWEHHERFDGTGYPQGLAGFDISYAARIVAVADTYDVMTSIRTYKKPMPSAAARRELARCAGTQFDPEVVRAFLNLSLGRLRMAMGPFSWLAQLALFPQVAAAQAAGSIATGTAVAVGAAAGTLGMAAAPAAGGGATPLAFSSGAAEAPLGGGWTAAVALVAEAEGVPLIVDAAPAGTDRTGVGGGPEPAPPAAPLAADEPSSEAPTAPAPPPVTTTTVASPATTVPPVPPPTTTAAAPPATTTTVPPPTTVAPPARYSLAYLAPSGPGDTVSQPVLPLAISAPPDITLPNYDTDRDGFPGVWVAQSADGVDGSDPRALQRFAFPVEEETVVSGDAVVHVFVAAKDFAPFDAVVEVGLYRCATTCTALAVADKTVPNASRFKPMTVDLGTIDLALTAGERLELRLAVPPESGGDIWLGFGTKEYRSWLEVEVDGDELSDALRDGSDDDSDEADDEQEDGA